MKLLISGAGVAGALMVVGGTPVAVLSQSAAPADPGAIAAAHSAAQDDPSQDDQSVVDSTEETTTKVDATDPGETSTEETPTEGTATETDEGSDLAAGLGEAHATAMKAWTVCVREAASGPKAEGQPIPPKAACWPKPLGPGQTLQQLGLTTDTDEADETDETAEPADTDGQSGPPEHAASHDRSHHAGASHGHHGG